MYLRHTVKAKGCVKDCEGSHPRSPFSWVGLLPTRTVWGALQLPGRFRHTSLSLSKSPLRVARVHQILDFGGKMM